MLCDQPFVSSLIIDSLIDRHEQTKKKIIICEYNNTVGVPVLFNRSLFSTLLSLNGPEGARKILAKYPDDIASIVFEMGGIDIDTMEDYEKLLRFSS